MSRNVNYPGRKKNKLSTLVLNATATIGTRVFLSISHNLAKTKTRYAELEGKKHLVVPMVMLTEGVHEGSQGKILYTKEELSSVPDAWNGKPIVLYHPTINGKGVSACKPEIFNSRKLGTIFNTKFDGRLPSEAWLDVDACNKHDKSIITRVENGEMVELSTGLWSENEEKEGEWNGEKYTAIARNLKPDHLALLPESKGACSIADGAGLNRNEVSFDSVRALLCSALTEEYGIDAYCYVLDVFRGFFIFQMSGKVLKQDYSNTDTVATLIGEPSEVVRVVQYQSNEGEVLASAPFPLKEETNKETQNMDKKAMVIALIANSLGVWEKTDEDYLMKQSDERLKKLTENMKKELERASTLPKAEEKPVIKNEEKPTEKKAMTFDELLANASPEVRDSIESMREATESEKERCIATITANSRNKFTKEFLAAKNVKELRHLAELAAPVENASTKKPPMFAGLADAGQSNIGSKDMKPMPIPSMDFSKK